MNTYTADIAMGKANELIVATNQPQNGEQENNDKIIIEPVINAREFNTDEAYIGHLAAIIESSEDAIISKSLDGIVRSWNKSAEKMFGYTSAEVVGKNISVIIPTEYINEEKMILDSIRNSETIKHYETVRIKKNGEKFYVSLTVSPIKDRAGKITGVSKIARDITSRKESELILEQQNKDLLKANSELDGFVYSTTHDLRSPLTSMLGLARLIVEESKELHTLEYAKRIIRSVDRLDDFIKDLLNYSQNTHSELAVEAVPIQKLTRDIVHSLHNLPGAEGITIQVQIDEQQPFYSDMRRCSTVLENLISNAIKYHKQNVAGRYINITGKCCTEYLHLRIEDNGIGIAQAHHDKIFNMFFRLPSSVAGSGFGLYIVKETIEKLQGSLQVNSQEGEGASFILKIKNFNPLPVNNKS